ncbi:hypothetical protein SAMN05892883_3237 [Jatrophihabitans sp. GAS493]|uniref:Zn-ribbon domain-containing OB-fold protein n=1 Tax=Jatrophihabitans sp. GAS493 TaxID=1907575 RepID=UPI000BC0C917|nr:Zn-ribbon domain-containing OB-fold protein [Jatrophihabitans sp. GAS493]SOD74062.1 hypothetical protein SAMN05892883_3237 [Jatrophihabitans sp. GAS493]
MHLLPTPITLHYEEELTEELQRYAAALLQGRIVGHKCPSCSRVYVPGKGFCVLCLIGTTSDNEVEVSDRGVITGFSIIHPVQYPGQSATEPFVYASVRLDGADSVLVGLESGQDISGVPHAELRAGMRVKAIWRPVEERTTAGITSRGWGLIHGVIECFTPTGEPDADESVYRGYLA